MYNKEINYIEGARRRYPDFTITMEIQKKMENYHEKLEKDGYEIKAANIAVKEGKFYWILYDVATGDISLELYGIVSDKQGGNVNG